MENNNTVLLEVKDLKVEFHTDDVTVHAVNGVTLALKEGETLGLVGETGAGKTTIARTILGILPKPQGNVTQGEIFFEGADMLRLSEKEMKKIRGDKIAMIFQDPMTALNPLSGWATRLRKPSGSTTESPTPRPSAAPWKCWKWWASQESAIWSFRTSSPAA